MKNLLELAEKQLTAERFTIKRKNFTSLDIINYAIRIRKWLDNQERNKKVAERRYKNG